jgi:hypothetical protein
MSSIIVSVLDVDVSNCIHHVLKEGAKNVLVTCCLRDKGTFMISVYSAHSTSSTFYIVAATAVVVEAV